MKKIFLLSKSYYDETGEIKYDHGGTRSVTLNLKNNYAVKKTRKVNNANYCEYMVWNRHKNDEFGKFLCPIIDITEDYSVLLMKIAKPLYKKNLFTDEEYAKYCDEYNKIMDEIEKNYPGSKNSKDMIRYANFGVYENRVVIIDYAGLFTVMK